MPIDPEKLLWELAGLEEEDGCPIPDDQPLKDYREGRLAPEGAEQVEKLLSRSRQARKRLVVLSGWAPAHPSSKLRSRVLASLPARRKAQFRWQRAALAAAATILMIVAAQLFWLDSPSPSPAFVPDYQMRVFGAAENRDLEAALSDPDVLRTYQVGPQARIRIELIARGASSEQAGYALFRLGEGRLEMLGEQQGVTLQVFRGAAAFQASLGPRPGRWQLYALVASKGRLPTSLLLQAGESPEAKLRAVSGGQVFPLQLEVLPDGSLSNQEGKEEE